VFLLNQPLSKGHQGIKGITGKICPPQVRNELTQITLIGTTGMNGPLRRHKSLRFLQEFPFEPGFFQEIRRFKLPYFQNFLN
jgi:hypothetical protein